MNQKQSLITEARSCALAGENKRAADLLDALDNLPRHLANRETGSEREIMMQLEVFRSNIQTM